jgi:hypothetical protein
LPRYLVESFLPRAPDMLATARARAIAVGAAAGIVHVRTSCVPADETCFDVYEAPSVEPVEAALAAAGLADARITVVEEAG